MGQNRLFGMFRRLCGSGVDNGKLLYSTQSRAARHPSISGAIHV